MGGLTNMIVCPPDWAVLSELFAADWSVNGKLPMSTNNGVQLVNNWTDHGFTENSGTIALVAGQRYDIKLEQAWLARELGVKIDERTLASYRMIDASENIPAIYELGARGAERQMTRDHLASVR